MNNRESYYSYREKYNRGKQKGNVTEDVFITRGEQVELEYDPSTDAELYLSGFKGGGIFYGEDNNTNKRIDFSYPIGAYVNSLLEESCENERDNPGRKRWYDGETCNIANIYKESDDLELFLDKLLGADQLDNL